MDMSNNTFLGKNISCPEEYNPDLLTPISRVHNREKLGINKQLPFFGQDIWNAWELSWLNAKGKPIVAIGTFEIPCESLHIIESKSLKLYLNSINQTSFSTTSKVLEVIQNDLSAAVGTKVKVILKAPVMWHTATSVWTDAVCLDDLDIDCRDYQQDSPQLTLNGNESVQTETLTSDLLRTNCPVTGQPDWATLYIKYTGRAISHEGLLHYIISMRNHQDFHEHCVETIFVNILNRCQPEKLAVYARYTRRGGLDINPFRSNFPLVAGNPKLARQ